MSLEDLTGTSKFIDALVNSNPVDATDTVASMAGHIRGIKNVLINCLDSVTGKVTATHTELNLMAAQEGGFLIKGVADAGGSVNAITAVFSPTITLTDKVVVIVRATGANTVAAPSFNPDGQGASSIVKDDNQPLVANSIPGAGYPMILMRSDANSNWVLLNPSNVVFAEIETGTLMLFQQELAPTGWTKQITHNDKALRIVSGSIADGGGDAFTSVFGSGRVTDSHTLTVSQMPAHQHGLIWRDSAGASAGTPVTSGNGDQFLSSASAGGGSGHAHNISNLDLAYVDIIIAAKD